MAEPGRRRVTFVTPTFAGDLERFRLLRLSMRALGMDVPHVAVVQTEDLPLFQRATRQDPGVTLVASADVLAPQAEKARRRGSGRAPRRPLPLAKRALQAAPGWRWSMSGWQAQQLVKLGAGSVVDTDHWVSLDSDSVFLRPVSADAFFDDSGLLLLNRLTGPGPQQARAQQRSARLLGLDPALLDPSVYYVDVPVPLHRHVVSDLLSVVEQRSGVAWTVAFQTSRATEYMAYGLYAEHLDVPRRTAARRLDMSRLLYAYDSAAFPQELDDALANGVSLVMIHSLLAVPMSEVQAALARRWGRP